MGQTTAPSSTSSRDSSRLDDWAYISPMAAFLLLIWIAGYWPTLQPLWYTLRTFLAAGLLLFFWKHYSRIRWSYAWLGVLFGILGVVQWVGMEKLILHWFPNYWRPSVEVVNPLEQIAHPTLRFLYIAVRWLGPTLVVPFMEELFWRDYLWRTLQAPNDFKMVEVGEWDWKPFLLVSALFASVHIQWITAIAWGLMVAALLVYTRSLGACIIMHAVTNFLLGAYVLYERDWYFW